jgi:uncharacterized DUF497 family protein
MSLSFEWDSKKARSNAKKHGVSFLEASTVFGDDESITIPDPTHSEVEERFVTIGRSQQGKILVVVATERGANLRIISARPANRRERRQYEQAD